MRDDESGGDAKFRLMFERSSDAILLLDTHGNQFVEYNQATLDMLCCSREELSALHPSQLSPPTQPDGLDSFAKANAMIATAVREGGHRFEWVHRSPHRSDFPVEVVLTPIQLGAIPLLLVVWRDISERKRSEDALRQAQRLESLGVLAGGIAHDFNNLLGAMVSYLTLARAELAETHPAVASLAQVERAVARATDLTRQMLAYGGRATFLVEPLDVSAAVRELTALLAASISKRIRIHSDLPDGLPAVLADRAQLQQVIMNLITNAAEAIGDAEGTIDLATRVVLLDGPTLERDLGGQELEPGRHVVLRVSDTGSGMTPEVLARVFDPFFTTKASGRGLGLSALRGILKAHKAGITIRSQPGRGSTFTIFVPASARAALVQAGTRLAPGRTRRARGTVLLVDDEDLVRRGTRGLLRSLGYSVVEASDGESALDLFRSDAGRIDWVLMDLTMPRMDGHETFLALRRIDPGVRVVLVSGWAASQLVERFHEDPPAAFLAKPFGVRELDAALAAAGID